MEYEVGYKKPPRSGCFKKGVSGNPTGRPKKETDPRDTAQQRAWNETIELPVRGVMTKMTLRRARVLTLVSGCLAGDLDAIEMFYKLPKNDPWGKVVVQTVKITHI